MCLKKQNAHKIVVTFFFAIDLKEVFSRTRISVITCHWHGKPRVPRNAGLVPRHVICIAIPLTTCHRYT